MKSLLVCGIINTIIDYSIWSLMRMISFIKRLKAFSLTELLIVLVIVAVLFAALAPIFTKRREGGSTANEPVWMYVKQDDQEDAFYDSGVPAYTSAALVGLEPNDISVNMSPYSKVYVKAKPYQNQIQFRYGADAGIGALTGVFTFDNKGNLMTVGRLQGNKDNNYNLVLKQDSENNTVAGMGALSQVTSKLLNNTVIGANSLTKGAPQNTVSVGRNSNMYGKASHSVLLGANTGKFENSSIANTVAIGSSSLSTEMNTGTSTNNVFLGSGTANVGFESSSNNVVAGSSYYGLGAKNNTILGYGTYTTGGNTNAQNFTIAGYGACDSFAMDTGDGSVTCLGYNSALNYGASNGSKGLGWENDSYEHIFIGGKPYGGMGGRSVLEIHNIPNSLKNMNSNPRKSPTVVLNSNLVVRGNLFFPEATYGSLMPHYQTYTQGKYSGTERGWDRCGRKCLGGRKYWHDGPKCKVFKQIIATVLTAAAFATGFILASAPTLIVIIGGLQGAAGGGAASGLFAGDSNSYNRLHDGPSASIIYLDRSYGAPSSYDDYPKGEVFPQLELPLQLSDRRTKENLSENQDALDKIMYVMPYNYTYKADKDNTPQVGVMAQDLEKYLPNSVSKDDKGYLSIRWDELFYVTINSVKNLDAKITGLNSSVDLVEKDSAMLAKEQKSTKNRIKEISKRIDKLEK